MDIPYENLIEFEVPQDNPVERIDVCVPRFYPGLFSRSRFRSLVREGLVRLNGSSVKPASKVNPGDTIVVKLPSQAPAQPDLAPEDIDLDVVYEDTSILVINKPRGIVVHPAAGHPKGTLVNAILRHCPGILKTDPQGLRPGIVHRLDKDTTGLMVVAKTSVALQNLQIQMKQRTAVRQYAALCKGRVSEDSGVIDAPLARDPKNRKRMAVHQDGREAVTEYEVLARFGNEYTLLKANLITGRTHQIRVHMAYIRHPVVGDPLYSRTKGELGLEGQALHAFGLGIMVPESNRYQEFFAPFPGDMLEALDTLKRRYKEELPAWIR